MRRMAPVQTGHEQCEGRGTPTSIEDKTSRSKTQEGTLMGVGPGLRGLGRTPTYFYEL
jgi:hypothetical protein